MDTDRHKLPHIHAEFSGEVAVYAIETGDLLAGSIPKNKHKLVAAWIEIHKESLMADWQLAIEGKSLFPIKGLDQ